MAYSEELIGLRNRYCECLRELNKTAADLNSSIKSVNRLVSIQGTCYSVNDISGGSYYLDHILEKQRNIYSNIVNNIIPGTNRIIDDLNVRIENALQEEAI